MRYDALGEFEQSVLLAIAHLGDGYGVTIRHEIETRTGRDIVIGLSIRRWAGWNARGCWLTMSDPTPQRGGRSKRHFVVSAAGAAGLRQSRERLAKMWVGLQPDLKRTRS